MNICYELVQPKDYAAAVEFALYTRQLLFPELYQGQIPKDLADFAAHYVQDRLGAFWLAKQGDEIIATAAYRAYNYRFDLAIAPQAVEVVKLFVQPEYRRLGIASILCTHLFEHAAQQGINDFYLHTHPFLPAAELFWQLQGFHLLRREQLSCYDTIHMFKHQALNVIENECVG